MSGAPTTIASTGPRSAVALRAAVALALIAQPTLAPCARAGQSSGGQRARLAKVLRALRKPKSIRADLRQVKTMHAFSTPQRARGEVIIVPPRHLRWTYLSPYQMVLIYDGKRASMSYPKLHRKQLIDLERRPTIRSIFETMLFFLDARPAAISEHFRVELLSAQAASGGGHGGDKRAGQRKPAGIAKLRLTPKRAKARTLVKTVTASVDTARGVLTELMLVEPDGDATRLYFDNIRVDQSVDRAKLKP